jgi:hypothetical protein
MTGGRVVLGADQDPVLRLHARERVALAGAHGAAVDEHLVHLVSGVRREQKRLAPAVGHRHEARGRDGDVRTGGGDDDVDAARERGGDAVGPADITQHQLGPGPHRLAVHEQRVEVVAGAREDAEPHRAAGRHGRRMRGHDPAVLRVRHGDPDAAGGRGRARAGSPVGIDPGQERDECAATCDRRTPMRAAGATTPRTLMWHSTSPIARMSQTT